MGILDKVIGNVEPVEVDTESINIAFLQSLIGKKCQALGKISRRRRTGILSRGLDGWLLNNKMDHASYSIDPTTVGPIV